MAEVLVRGARLPDWEGGRGQKTRIEPGRQVDVRIGAGVVTAMEPGLAPRRGEDVLDAAGAVILPGLHDHHLHLRAMVAARRSVAVGPPDVASASAMGAALRRAPIDGAGWRRAVGYHESVAGELDRAVLDALAPDAPLRVQHRSGAMWIVNSAGVGALGLDDVDLSGVERDGAGRPTGRLFRLDDWLAGRLGVQDPAEELAGVSRELAARGVTGVTDATPDATAAGVAALVRAVDSGRLVQRLHVMCPPDVEVPAHALVTRGPHKVLLDDDRLPSLDSFAEVVRASHAAGTPMAVHCVTAAQLALAVAAFESAGALSGDRVEHGSVVDPAFVAVLTRLGLTVVTNPGFVHARGDAYLHDVDERDVPHLYPCASLLAAGVPVAAGTDAPFGPADPWTAVRAAVTRGTMGGRTLGADEAVPLEHSVGLFTGAAASPGRRARVEVGAPGDLCLLADGALPCDSHGVVLATVVDGHVVHGAG